ncbi:MAG: hypothetical protein WCQ44_13545 [Opitutaceae bacterium]
MQPTDPRAPANLRLPPHRLELNPVERFGGLLKAQVPNRHYSNLSRLKALASLPRGNRRMQPKSPHPGALTRGATPQASREHCSRGA